MKFNKLIPYDSINTDKFNEEENYKLLNLILESDINIPIRKIDKPIILYGAGSLGILAKHFFDYINIQFKYMVDKNAKLLRKDPNLSGITILSPDEVSEDDKNNCLVIICTVKTELISLRNQLINDGWKDVFFFYDISEAYTDKYPLNNGWYINKLSKEEIKLINETYLSLDKKSRMHYLHFIAWRKIRISVLSKHLEVDMTNRFFIPEVLNVLKDNEIFVDCGAHLGFVIERFIKLINNKYKKIYAIEPDKDNLIKLEKYLRNINNTVLIKKALSNEKGEKRFYKGFYYASQISEKGNDIVEVITLDSLNIPATMIKMHLEGKELDVIKGSEKTININRPIIALTIYHNSDGIWKTPLYLIKNLKNYNFHIRLHAWGAAGAVLYAIPKERTIKKKVNKMKNKKRNVLFIVLPYLVENKSVTKSAKIRSFKAFPYGVLSIASYLKKFEEENVNIEILDCNIIDDDHIDLIKNKIQKFNPEIVGISMMFDNSYQYLNEITKEIKSIDNNIVTILGGSAATSSYKAIIEEQQYLDAVCFSEGEIPFLDIVNSKNKHYLLNNHKSFVTRKTIKSNKIPQPSFVTNLDNVVNIDYSFVNVLDYGMKEAFSPFANNKDIRRQFFLVTSRGCPFKCVFCMRSSDNDKSMRYASVEKVIEHVEFLVNNYNMNILTIYDDQILFNKNRAKQIFKELARFNLRIECPNGLSVAYIDDELAQLMRQAGMDTVYLAIESGSAHVLNNIIHKPLTLDKVKPVVQILRKYDFWIQGYFVNGLPGEMDFHREETVKFIKDIELDWSGFSLATPSRGSELYKICIEKGYIKKDIGIGEMDTTKYIIKTPDYEPEYVTRKSYLMNLDVNFVNNYRMKKGDYKIAADCFRDVISRYADHAFAYYFLAKALYHLKDIEQSKKAIKKVNEIIKNDEMWRGYFDEFNIDISEFENEINKC